VVAVMDLMLMSEAGSGACMVEGFPKAEEREVGSTEMSL
jgi:hypothetical protein